jgi:Mn2+/Fe2+ NRAMP family transporter
VGAVALGIVAAIGGFVDVGELVFNTQAGARFGYAVLWAVPVGVLGIIVFAEMAGRVAAIGRRASFDLVRDGYGRRLGTLTLVCSLALNFLTFCAELGGVGLALQLLFDATPQLFMLLGLVVLMTAAWLLPFEGLERLFGYGGLGLLVYAVAAYHLHPDWQAAADGLVPELQSSGPYLYFVVGMLAAAFMPYEIYFYSSGGIEEGWSEDDLGANRANAIIGFALGGVLSAALVIVAAQVLLPAGVTPDTLGTTALAAQHTFGEAGLILALTGVAFAVGGAAIDTCFSGAYNLAQYMRWDWGHNRGPRGAPRWYATVATFFVGGYAIIATGIDPIRVTEYAVVLSAIVLPLTYLPLLRAAGDRDLMGDHANGPLASTLGWLYFGVIVVVAIAAPVLLVATNGGSG